MMARMMANKRGRLNDGSPSIVMDTKKPKVIAIYRVSTDEQAHEDRAGLPRQRKAVARVVTQHDLDAAPEAHKRCRICHQTKPLAEFYLLQTKKGTWPYCACKDCTKQLQKEALQKEAHQRRKQRAASNLQKKTP